MFFTFRSCSTFPRLLCLSSRPGWTLTQSDRTRVLHAHSSASTFSFADCFSSPQRCDALVEQWKKIGALCCNDAPLMVKSKIH